MKAFVTILFIAFSFSSLFAAEVQYDYNKLRFTEYDQLRRVKTSALNTSRKFDYKKYPNQAQTPLKEALRMFYSRPNEDNVIRSLTSDIEGDLKLMNLYEKTIRDIIDESKAIIKDKSLSTSVRATAILCINNALVEIKPQILDNVELARVVCEFADENLKVPTEIQNDTLITSMMAQTSPTNTAKKIMYWYAEKKQKKISKSNQGCPFSKKAT